MTLSWRIAAILLSGALLLAWLPAAAAAPAPQAGQGRLTLTETPSRPLPLAGQWGFAWGRFLDPGWTRLPAGTFVTAPESWNPLTADGKTPGPDGAGSYVLEVNCPADTALAVDAVGQRTASRLYVNGHLVSQHGRVGLTPATTDAAVHHRVPISREFACPLRITLHIANFEHRGGGFVRPIFVAPADVLAREREFRASRETVLLSAYLMVAVVALIFFAVRRRERAPLAFGLFCIAIAVYTDLISERLLLRLLPGGELDWTTYMAAEYLSWVAAMAMFFLTLRSLFPHEIHRRMTQAVLIGLGAGALMVVVLPPALYSHVARPGQTVAVLVAGYVVVALLRVRDRTRRDARVLLAGMLVVLVAQIADLLLLDDGTEGKLGPFGFALFLLSPAFVIARRMSLALNAEERNRALEENARLREDVERISRHDLKTPLNSILGVTRLLRDDTRLTTEQRELVGVLQRAGLRMLEMVNLSLGLFRMETGNYDFRAQAVDLRDVVTRVLVDLHSYAEANDVTLHLLGSDHRPLYVRAEELLCYSIVANLVKNAVEAAAPGERVSLALTRGDPVLLSVHNPGEVPPEIAARFFEKYVTAGKSRGTGLGTYSARLMARAQQGELDLLTGPDGTTLTLTLPPLAAEPGTPEPERPALPPATEWLRALPTRQVLLVDDDEYTRLVMRRFLPHPPYEVETAANAQAALDAMQRHWPNFLLLDMEMPFLSGIEVVQRVRAREAAEQRPRCRILMVSGNDDEASAATARAAGADRFLVKPVSREALLAAMRELEDAPAGVAPAPAADPGAPDLAWGAGDEVVPVDPEWLEFFPDFIRAQRDTVEAIARALAAGDREDVRFLAHRATGGLATMGLDWAARMARSVEKDALRGSGDELVQRIDALRAYLRNVRIEAAER